ncbi:LCP family protein [[Clostridium] leptum]|nr:LCP family protein [[Clostridium] leptum]
MSKHDSFHGAPYDNDDSSRDIYSNSRSSQSSSGRRPPNRKKGKTKKILIRVLLVILALLIVTGVAGALYINYLLGLRKTPDDLESMGIAQLSSSTSVSGSDVSQPPEVKDIMNVLLIGSDTRSQTNRGNSDSMIIFTVDGVHKKIKMTSIMRDIYVSIPGHKEQKINAAYAIGGPDLLMDTIEQAFDIRLDYYAIVDFSMFENVVNKIGGVDIELTEAEANYMNKKNNPDIDQTTTVSVGLNHMDGKTALNYSRIRHLTGDDFQRTQRQRNMLRAIVDQSKNLNILEINGLVQEILPNVTTNLSDSQILSLAMQAGSILNYPINELRIPADGTWTNTDRQVTGTDALDIDFKANSDLMKDFIYEGENPDKVSAEPTSVEKTGSEVDNSSGSSAKKTSSKAK